MERFSEADLEELQRKVEDLQRQNQILRLERELDGFEKDIGERAHLSMSTPMTGRFDMSSGPGQLRFTNHLVGLKTVLGLTKEKMSLQMTRSQINM